MVVEGGTKNCNLNEKECKYEIPQLNRDQITLDNRAAHALQNILIPLSTARRRTPF